jgi:hypothetical protein
VTNKPITAWASKRLEAQRQRIAAYCALKGLHLAEEFEDALVSGGKPLATRSAGSRLLTAAKNTNAVVVVAKLDRLFWSVADASCAHTTSGVLVAAGAFPIENHVGHRRAARVLGDQIEDANLNQVPRPDRLINDAVVGFHLVAHDEMTASAEVALCK